MGFYLITRRSLSLSSSLRPEPANLFLISFPILLFLGTSPLTKSCSMVLLQPHCIRPLFSDGTSPLCRTLRNPASLFRPLLFRNRSSLSAAQCAVNNGAGGGGRSGALTPPRVVDDVAQKIDVNPPKGTRDFPPEEMRLRSWLFDNFREVRVLTDFS